VVLGETIRGDEEQPQLKIPEKKMKMPSETSLPTTFGYLPSVPWCYEYGHSGLKSAREHGGPCVGQR